MTLIVRAISTTPAIVGPAEGVSSRRGVSLPPDTRIIAMLRILLPRRGRLPAHTSSHMTRTLQHMVVKPAIFDAALLRQCQKGRALRLFQPLRSDFQPPSIRLCRRAHRPRAPIAHRRQWALAIALSVRSNRAGQTTTVALISWTPGE